MPTLNPQKTNPLYIFTGAGHSSVLVETCDACTLLGTLTQLFTYNSKITEERMLALNPNKPPSVNFNQAGHSSVFVETCDARTLLETVTRLFISASVHFLLFKCSLAYLFTVSPHI